MTPLLVAYGIGSLLVLLWMAARLRQTPDNLPLWAMTGLVGCWALAFPLGLAADHNTVILGIPPAVSRLVQYGVLLLGVNCLISFFLFSALPAKQAWRRTWLFLVPLAVAVTILTVTTTLIPDGVRTKEYTVTSVAAFWITADVYMAFGFAATGIWALRFARTAHRRLALGLRIASVGLAGIVIADCFFVPAIVIRWNGGDAAPSLDGSAETTLGFYGAVLFLLPGIVLCLIGVTFPAAMTQLAAFRVWRHHLRSYQRLGPLWTHLNARFPEDALHRVPGVGGVHRRYYRRVIECRDGLVRISPYLDGDEELAVALKTALRTDHEQASQQAVPVAIPERDGLDADVEQLISLSEALRVAR
ncbi:MAB_1171c family putative transporter [Actinocrispum wychmicini]|uniref:MAB_1171c family putative transporter n=1 Tax=Actinocrispum wychmicini TaxID=1213861 RepID=UPI001051BDA8|nr:MAB_1171c family putative transporter [Actinocrispum wychmicini]